MDNLSICKRIAEIEGLLVSKYKLGTDDLWVHTCPTVDSSVTLFNPFDDALCFQLMVKYKVDVEFFVDCVSGYIGGSCKGETIDESPSKAILLAIIEAHKD